MFSGVLLLIGFVFGLEQRSFKTAFLQLFQDNPVIYRALWMEPDSKTQQKVYMGELTQDEKAHIMEWEEDFWGDLAGEWLKLKVKLHWRLAQRVNTCDMCLYRRILLPLYAAL